MKKITGNHNVGKSKILQLTGNEQAINKDFFKAVCIGIIFIRLLISLLPSYKTDMGGYEAWSLYLAQKGFNGFYNTFHVVYAPAYMYLLLISGKISVLFHLNYNELEFLIKLWSVAADLLGGILIYLIGKRHNKVKFGFFIFIMYSLNPGIFFNSSIWGQFDSIPATMLLFCLFLFDMNKKVTAAIVFATAILTKPQSGILLPVIFILFFDGFFRKKLWNSKEFWRKTFSAALGCICTYVVLVASFYSPTTGLSVNKAENVFYRLYDFIYWLPNLYFTSVGDYPYATANAFNFWTLVGGQTVKDTERFLYGTYSFWGLFLVFLSIIFSLWFFWKNRSKPSTIYITAYFFYFSVFMFATRMHERYIFPALTFLAVALLWEEKLKYTMIGLSLCYLGNQWYVYYLSNYESKSWVSRDDKFAFFIALITILFMIYTIKYMVSISKNHSKDNLRGDNT